MPRTFRTKILALLLVAGGLTAGAAVWQAATRTTSTTTSTLGGRDVFTSAKNVADCTRQARAFTDYPLVWAGPSVLGYPLVHCDHMMTKTRYAPDGQVAHPGGDSWAFGYGTCVTTKGQESCPVPISIIISPCALTIEGTVIPKGSQPVRSMTVRGAQADVNEYGISFEQSPQIITIGVELPPYDAVERANVVANAVKVAEALIPANALADPLSRGAPLTAAFAAAPDTLCRNSFVPAPPATPDAPAGNAMALDADANTPAIVDASRTVTGSAPFAVGINVTAAADAYKGYQWKIEYPGAGLAFDGGVSENTGATGLTACVTSAVNAAPLTPGNAVYGGGCITLSPDFTTNYTGQTTTFNMHCLAAGTFSVQLVGAAFIAPDGGVLNAAMAAITVTCA